MKLKHSILLIACLLSINTAFAQYAEDALRFSQTEQGATARFRALGNAQTALGGDLSSLSGNPAGLGLLTRSDVSLTADFFNTNVKGTYFNQNSQSEVDKLSLSQLGVVWHSAVRKPAGSDLNTGWLSFNFGVSYNKTNNLNSNIDYQGTNPSSSFADYLAEIASAPAYLNQGKPSSQNPVFRSGSLEDMAYNNFLIEYNADGYFPTTSLGNTQRNLVFNSGSQSEVNFGFGANYSNRFYIGASLGLTSLNYNSDREFIEAGDTRTFTGQDPEFLNGAYNLSYRTYQSTNGSGVNGKIGMIYRASDNIRIGANFITPTWYSISDNYSEVLDTRYTRSDGSTIPAYTNNEDIFESDYTLRTPYKLNGGIALTINNQGLITGDVEYVDYAFTQIRSNDVSAEDNTNEDIRNNYTSAVNFRVGGEYKLDNIYLRAGYNTKGNPYKNADYSASVISGGLGYRVNNFYIDLTYANSTVKYTSRPYLISENYPDFPTTGNGEAASLKNNRGSVFFTLGTRF